MASTSAKDVIGGVFIFGYFCLLAYGFTTWLATTAVDLFATDPAAWQPLLAWSGFAFPAFALLYNGCCLVRGPEPPRHLVRVQGPRALLGHLGERFWEAPSGLILILWIAGMYANRDDAGRLQRGVAEQEQHLAQLEHERPQGGEAAALLGARTVATRELLAAERRALAAETSERASRLPLRRRLTLLALVVALLCAGLLAWRDLRAGKPRHVWRDGAPPAAGDWLVREATGKKSR